MQQGSDSFFKNIIYCLQIKKRNYCQMIIILNAIKTNVFLKSPNFDGNFINLTYPLNRDDNKLRSLEKEELEGGAIHFPNFPN